VGGGHINVKPWPIQQHEKLSFRISQTVAAKWVGAHHAAATGHSSFFLLLALV